MSSTSSSGRGGHGAALTLRVWRTSGGRPEAHVGRVGDDLHETADDRRVHRVVVGGDADVVVAGQPCGSATPPPGPPAAARPSPPGRPRRGRRDGTRSAGDGGCWPAPHRFDWAGYARQVAALAQPGEKLRIEPGRAVSVYAGWYVTEVLDVKKAHGQWYAVLRGGTMHIRTPVTKQHNHPFVVLPRGGSGPAVDDEPVTLVGQLCTPKDVFARRVPTDHLAIGDVVAFSMAGAYAWNISHHDFLMHPKPGHHYLSDD